MHGHVNDSGLRAGSTLPYGIMYEIFKLPLFSHIYLRKTKCRVMMLINLLPKFEIHAPPPQGQGLRPLGGANIAIHTCIYKVKMYLILESLLFSHTCLCKTLCKVMMSTSVANSMVPQVMGDQGRPIQFQRICITCKFQKIVLSTPIHFFKLHV